MGKTSGKSNKKKAIKKKKRKISLIIVLIIIVIGGISAYLLTSPNFVIKEISVKGNSQLSTQKIRELAEIKIGDNIFSKIGIISKVRLKQNGYVEDATIRKTYPNKIEIEIKEREKQFQIKLEDEGYIYIDEQGYILEYGIDKLQIPVITGMNKNKADLCQKHRLDKNDLDKMENILQIREECRHIQIADKITQIEVGYEYVVNLENDGIKFNLGDATNLKNRMYYVKAILKQETGNRGTIYVNGNLNEGFTAYFSAE